MPFTQGAFILNPSTVHQLFKEYSCVEGGLEIKDGLIKQAAARGVLSVYVSRSLSSGDWERIFFECSTFKVALRCSFAVDVPVPAWVSEEEKALFQAPKVDMSTSWTVANIDRISGIITSTDVELTALDWYSKNPDYVVIDISGAKPADFMTYLTAEPQSEGQKYHFSMKTGCIKNMLMQGRKVLIKGDYTAENLDAIGALLQSETRGILHCLTIAGGLPLPCPSIGHHVVDESMKKAYVQKSYGTLLNLDFSKPYTYLAALHRANKAFPGQSYDPWLGAESVITEADDIGFDVLQSKERAALFTRKGLKLFALCLK